MFSLLTAPGRGRVAARPGWNALRDVAVAAAMLAGSLALLEHGPHGGIDALRRAVGQSNLVSVALTVCSTVPLAAWRRFPLGVFAATAAASTLLAGLGYPLGLLLGPTAALYLLVAGRQPQTPRTRRTIVIVVGLVVAILGTTAAAQGTLPGSEPFDRTGLALVVALAWAAAWFAGERIRLRREQVAELRERALRLEREAERERLLAAAQERARIARDLHDSAGHAISVITVRAGTARLRHHQDPDRSLAALEAIEELARQTVEEIDQIVGTLRQGGPAAGAVEAPAGLASLGTLVAHHRAAGLEVTLDTAGEPRPLAGAVDQAAYRILQEALTNAARHGAGSARVEVEFGDAAVVLTVTNPVPATQGVRRSGGGRGLVGMRERATLLGGNLDIERSDGRFRVRTRVPTGATARDARADRRRRRAGARRAGRAACRRAWDRGRGPGIDRARGHRASAPARPRRRPDGRAHARPRRHRRHPRAFTGGRLGQVLILTTFEQDDYVFGALRAGASGFLLKRARPEELIAAVRTVAAGDALLSPSVTRRVIDRMAQQPTPELADQARLDALTPREREVLELIARGLSNREIAAALAVEESTIRTHVKRTLMKLQLRDRIQAVIFAYETGLNHPAVRQTITSADRASSYNT